jgi:signal transduction histidine kinase
MAEGHRVRTVVAPGEELDVKALVDAEVRVRGVCTTEFSQGLGYGVWLHLNSAQQITVEKPAVLAAFEQEIRPASSLLRLNPEGAWSHRVRTRGVVTCVRAREMIFVQDTTGPVQVFTSSAPGLVPGDEVEAVGFVRPGELHAIIEDALVQRVGRLPTPEPRLPRLSQLLSGRQSGHLVRLSGKLIDQVEDASGMTLLLQRDGRVFQAQLPTAEAVGKTWEPGAQLAVTGICVFPLEPARSGASDSQATTFNLLLRSASDVAVMSEPSWWTASRIGSALAIALAGMTGALCWGIALNSRVRRQTALIQDKVRLEERSRIVRDLHGTLTQSLAGVAFQLEGIRGRLGALPPAVREQFSGALNMLRHSLGEARRSVMNLRALGVERTDLLRALEETTRPIVGDSKVRLTFVRQGNAEPLTARVEHQLLRLGQEAIANSLQHGRAVEVRVTLSQSPLETILQVADNGSGIAPAAGSASGHFGIAGMRERAAQISAVLDIVARASTGTIVRITVPASSGSATPEAHV